LLYGSFYIQLPELIENTIADILEPIDFLANWAENRGGDVGYSLSTFFSKLKGIFLAQETNVPQTIPLVGFSLAD